MNNSSDKTNNESFYKMMVDNPLPPMTLRIGVAGHRDLSAIEDLDNLRNRIRAIYDDIYDVIQNISPQNSKNTVAQTIYQNNAEAVIRIISSLAEGADRLCIEKKTAGNQKGVVTFEHELACILPFSKENFEQDFLPENSIVDHHNGTVSEFNAILEKIGYGKPEAQVIELDGDPAKRDEAYYHCSKLLVEHSDILIAVYDGDDSKDEGTTATVNAAKQHGIPVIHVSTQPDMQTHFYCSTRFGYPTCTENYTTDSLRKELHRLLLFTDVLNQTKSDETTGNFRKQEILGRFKQYQTEMNLQCIESSPIDFDNSGPIELINKYGSRESKVFDFLKKLIARPKWIQKELNRFNEESADSTLSETSDDVSHHFTKRSLNRYFAAYLRADRLANYYARIHRSTFVLIYLLGVLALVAAVFALVSPKWAIIIFVLTELGLLAAIFKYYRKDHQEKHHDRWLEYRCLAEFLRPMRYLTLLGRPYSISNFRDTEEYLSREIIGHSAVGRSWLYIHTETISRWSGFDGCRLDTDSKQSINDFIRKSWLNMQIRYHNLNAATMHVLGRNLGRLSFGIFFATVFFVIGKLTLFSFGLLNHSEIAHGFTATSFAWLAAILPMLATTAYAIRNHAEFDISAQRSLTMRAALIFRRKKFITNQTSQQMSATLNEIATETIKETADWLEIYEVKESELG